MDHTFWIQSAAGSNPSVRPEVARHFHEPDSISVEVSDDLPARTRRLVDLLWFLQKLVPDILLLEPTLGYDTGVKGAIEDVPQLAGR